MQQNNINMSNDNILMNNCISSYNNQFPQNFTNNFQYMNNDNKNNNDYCNMFQSENFEHYMKDMQVKFFEFQKYLSNQKSNDSIQLLDYINIDQQMKQF